MSKKKVWILSNISSKQYGDSTRPYFLGKGLSESMEVEILHVCKVSKLEDGVVYEDFVKDVEFNNFKSAVGLVKKLIRKMNKEGRPDVLYTHQLLLGLIGLVVLFLKGGFKVVADFHTSEYLELLNEPISSFKQKVKKIIIPFLEKVLYFKSGAIITVSEETKLFLRKEYGKNERVFLIKNGTDTDKVFPLKKVDSKEISQYNFNESDFVAVFPNPRDGFFSNYLALEFLEQVALFLKESDNIKIIVLGGGELPSWSFENVIFTGYVKDYNQWLNLADVCIATYPGNAVCGGVRNKVCDYLAVEKPIIATRESLRGFDDLIEGKHFILADSPVDFANTLKEASKGNIDFGSMKLANGKAVEGYLWKDKSLSVLSVLQQVNA